MFWNISDNALVLTDDVLLVNECGVCVSGASGFWGSIRSRRRDGSRPTPLHSHGPPAALRLHSCLSKVYVSHYSLDPRLPATVLPSILVFGIVFILSSRNFHTYKNKIENVRRMKNLNSAE